jgi:hypothetical protein
MWPPPAALLWVAVVITQSQFISVMGWIATWEQEQISAAKSVLRSTGELVPA